MKLEEYVKLAKKELDEFEANWKKQHNTTPEDWPLEMNDADWGVQELASRFDQII